SWWRTCRWQYKPNTRRMPPRRALESDRVPLCQQVKQLLGRPLHLPLQVPPEVLKKFQRRADELALLVREAFLRGISTRQVASLEEAAHHQRHRALFCRDPAAHPAHGLLCERQKRGSNHLFHLPALQPGMEKPHPQGFYTSRVTSPGQLYSLTKISQYANFGMCQRSANSKRSSSRLSLIPCGFVCWTRFAMGKLA